MNFLPAHKFDNRFTRDLPGDPENRNFTRQVQRAFWSKVLPTTVSSPTLIAHSKEVADFLELTSEQVNSPLFAKVFSGNNILPGMEPFAACYGGHQFGSWAGQLGDGRAISLGEYINEAGQRWELQLKGAGPTPYSRTADGRAVLRSSLREFLCSEAMHHLGVPTTRALSLVLTGDQVMRDMLYDGNPQFEPGAIVCRVAPSFIRFGNFEIFASRGDTSSLEKLVDFVIDRDFSEIKGDKQSRRVEWFRVLCERTAQLIVDWMRVGFVHGVMNTDNMSVLGLTIDYGPYGWVDNFDPGWTPNTTDASGHRYAFARQAQIAHWNLACLADALIPVFDSKEDLKAGLSHYIKTYTQAHRDMTQAKFGLTIKSEEMSHLTDEAFELMHASELDMTLFFRYLANLKIADPQLKDIQDAFYSSALFEQHELRWQDWLQRYAQVLKNENSNDSERKKRMDAVNPLYVLRNYLAQEAIDLASSGDYSRIHDLLEVLRHPYTEKEELSQFAQKRPEWAKTKVGCSMLSCSS